MAFTLLLGATLLLYVQGVRGQAENGRELNQGLRGSTLQLVLLANDVSNAELSSENAINAIEAKLETDLFLTETITDLFAANNDISREEYSRFLTNLTSDYPNITLAGYAQVINYLERENFEAQLAEDGLQNTQIYELNDTGNPVVSGGRREYVPYLYAEPFTTRSNLIGFDLNTSPERLQAIELARDSGELVSTPPIPLLQADQALGVVIFRPVYSTAQIPTTVEARRANIQGYVAVSINLQSVIDSALADLNTQVVVSRITDVTDGTLGIVFYENTSAAIATGFESVQTIEVFGRQWQITLIQSINIPATLQEIESLNTSLQERLDALENGSEALGLTGISRHDSQEVPQNFQNAKSAYAQLEEQLASFFQAQTPTERATAFQVLRLQSEATFEAVDSFVNSLETEITQETEQATQQATIIAISAVLATFVILFSLAYIINNLNYVNRSALKIAEGDLTARVNLSGQDEIGQLAHSLNQLTQRLQTNIDSLESQVAEQTRDLSTVLDVNSQISTILQVDRLLQDVSDLVKERFGLYHAHIYLVNELGDQLQLAAGAGYVGRQMISEKRRIDMANPRSIVANAARTRGSVNVADVRQSPTFLPHPLLPNTLSEFATALIARGQVIGVLDVQSDQDHFFTAQIQTVLETTASQIATAISNARLFEYADRTSRREQALGAITQKMQTATDVDEVLQTVVRELGKALRVPHTTIQLQLSSQHSGLNPAPLPTED